MKVQSSNVLDPWTCEIEPGQEVGNVSYPETYFRGEQLVGEVDADALTDIEALFQIGPIFEWQDEEGTELKWLPLGDLLFQFPSPMHTAQPWERVILRLRNVGEKKHTVKLSLKGVAKLGDRVEI